MEISSQNQDTDIQQSNANPLVDACMPAVPAESTKSEKAATRQIRRISDQTVIFSGVAGSGIGERICACLGAESGKLVLGQFANSETRIEVHESVRNRHAFVVASIGTPVNEGFMQTALLVQALKLADADKITVVLPYFPYSRQDRKADTRPPISARAVTDILTVMGAHQIVTVDLHATQVEGFFDGPFENLSGLNQLVPSVLVDEGSEVIVVSPDAGGAKRAEGFARKVEQATGNFTPLVVMSKFRPGPGAAPQVTLSCGSELLAGKTCVLVDDMIDTGGSIIAAANALKERGAARVVVCASHAVFSNNAADKLRMARTSAGQPSIDRIFTTDTLPVASAPKEFLRVVTVAPLIAEAISRLDQPLGSLRELRDRTDLGGILPDFDWTALKVN
jgi:ribose-phosphate pyrophosphokinase